MKPSITLGRLFGVDIGLHYSWFIIALLGNRFGLRRGERCLLHM